MEANGDPPTSPQPERITPDALLRLLTSTDSDENVQALNMIHEDPSIYTTISSAQLKGIFIRCLLEASSAPLRLATRNAFIALAGHVRRGRDNALITTLFAPIARTLISTEQDLPSERMDGGNCLRTLEELTAALPEVIRPHLVSVIALCHQIVHSTDKVEYYRQRAIKLLATLCQQASDAIPEDRLPDIVASCLTMMANVDDDIAAWLAGPAWGREQNDTGKDAFRIIVTALFETTIVPVTLQLTEEFLKDGDWRLRHAALQALAIIGTTGRILMTEQILGSAKPALKDQHPRVRQLACYLFHLMAGNLEPNVDKSCLNDVVPALIELMADMSMPRVASSAAQAIDSFMRLFPSELVSAHSDEMITVIARTLEAVAGMPLLTRWNDLLSCDQLGIITSLARSSAATAKDLQPDQLTSFRMTPQQFGSVYDRIINSMKRILRARDGTFKTLRIATLDCLMHMNGAVGKTKASADASEVLPACASLIASMSADDIEGFLFALKGYCNSLGDGCAPHLPLLMPLLTQRAICPAFVPGSSLSDFMALDYRCQEALNIIEDFAKNLGATFAPYVAEVSTIILNNLMTSHHASTALPSLLSCIKHKGLPAMRVLWLTHWNALQAAFKDIRQRNLHAKWLSVIGCCVKLLGSQGLAIGEVKEIGDVIVAELRDLEPRSEVDEYDEDSRQEHIANLVIWLIKAVGANCFATIHMLMPMVLSKMEHCEKGIRIIRIYILYAPDASFWMAYIFHDKMSEILLKSLAAGRTEPRWEAAYTFGCIALLNRSRWSPLAVRALPSLVTAISRPDARDSFEAICATENAVSAVAQIIKCCDGVDMNQYLPWFLDWLFLHGMQEEETETVYVYGLLAELIEKRHPLIIGEKNANWAKLVKIIVQTLHRNVFEENAQSIRVFARLITILQNIKVEDERLFNQCVSEARFEASEKETLDKVIS